MEGLKSYVELCKKMTGRNEPIQEHILLKQRVDRFNAREGNQVGYHCELCKDKAWVQVLYGEEIRYMPCKCQLHRKNFKKLIEESSGYREKYFNSRDLPTVSLDDFNTYNETARIMKKGAQEFIRQYPAKWFFIGGQSGSGKSRITKAILTILETEQGIKSEFMSWVEAVKDLKLSQYEHTGYYQKQISVYKNVPLLLIDDIFKANVTEADKSIAYEILDARYRNSLPTIINSEKYISEILDIDEALGGRITEKGIVVTAKRDAMKNYRLHGDNL